MMIGPMRKKVITSSVVTAIILIIIFVALAFVYISQNNKTISELKQKGEVVQRYVFTKDLTAGTVITAEDIKYVDVKGESAPLNSYEYRESVVNGKKTVVDRKNSIIGKRLKVNVNEKTIVTESLFFEDDKMPNLDTRLQEFNMITLPSDLNVGDYIDVRIRFATGEDFSVLVGKEIKSFGATGSQSNTIFLKLSEEEIVRMSSAIIESYINDGIMLYANKYVDPANQLFDYDYIDLVEEYEKVRYVSTDTYNIVSGEMVSGTSKTERSDEAIAGLLGIEVADVRNIKNAIASEDETTLELYKNKLVTKEKSIVPTYPVKLEVATLIKNNPNILSEVKAKYDVESLISERENLPNTDIVTKDQYTGEEKNYDDHINHVKEKLDKEISAQRTERQEYLLKLLSKQQTANSTDKK
ncbi:MAG: hypothetical protein IJ220_04960 [Clostridia bacterium]|nr:hypothetical protein [Clostridia bacterium]